VGMGGKKKKKKKKKAYVGLEHQHLLTLQQT
jgi:hypothetical protein